MPDELSPQIIAHIKDNLTRRIGHAAFARRLSQEFGELVTAEQVMQAKGRLKEDARGYVSPRASFHAAVKAPKVKKHILTDWDPDFSFERKAVLIPKVSQHYFVRGIGLVEYLGSAPSKVLDQVINTHTLLMVGGGEKGRRLVPDAKMKEIRFMELAKPGDFGRVIEKLQNGTCTIKLPKRGKGSSDADVKFQWDQLLLSGDLGILANIACARFRDEREDNSLKVASDRALDLLSAEYAFVMGQEKAYVLKMFQKVSGRDDLIAKIEATSRKGGKKPVLQIE